MSRLAKISFVVVGSVLVQAVGGACTSSELSFTSPDAGAEEPEVVVSPCDKVQSFGAGTKNYAQAIFGNASAEDLMASVVVAKTPTGVPAEFVYELSRDDVLFGNQIVWAECGPGTTVTFIKR